MMKIPTKYDPKIVQNFQFEKFENLVIIMTQTKIWLLVFLKSNKTQNYLILFNLFFVVGVFPIFEEKIILLLYVTRQLL
jgi:hypothetical protein